ncbi:MAG: DUF6106 family protein [Clostridiales bacterium]|nr:DUF6106 family protein [Clostridiales bacterium]
MDIFCEYMVKHKKSAKDSVLNVLCVILAVILSMAIMMFFLRFAAIAVLVVAGIWYGVAYIIRSNDIEYEYILTNSILDIDKIMAKKMRKRVMSINFKEIACCEPANGRLAPADSSVKMYDFTGDITGKSVYYVDFNKDGSRVRVYFQPNAKILKNLKSENPGAVTIKEEDIL